MNQRGGAFELKRVHVSLWWTEQKPGAAGEASEQNTCKTEAVVSVRAGKREKLALGEGNGPVCALDNALYSALKEFWPSLERVHLQKYDVHVVTGQAGTDAMVRVTIAVGNEAGPQEFTEVSTNVLEASWRALARCYQHQLEQQGLVPKTGQER